MRTPSRSTLLLASGHAVLRVLALLGLERLLMDGRLDGLLRPLGLYSDDPVGAGLGAFMLIALGAGTVALVDALVRRRRTPVWVPVAVWAAACTGYGVVSGLWSGGSPGDVVFGVVLMGAVAAFGAVPGVATGTAVRLALTPNAAPGVDALPSAR